MLIRFSKDLNLPVPTKKEGVHGGLATIPSSLAIQSSPFMLYQNSSFMNKSGETLKSFWSTWIKKYRPDTKWNPQLIVLRDELDLEIGKIKYRAHSRTTNGHNGLKSLKQCLDLDWTDIAVGIGRPASKDSKEVASYVLSPFNNGQKTALFEESYPQVRDLLLNILDSGSVDI